MLSLRVLLFACLSFMAATVSSKTCKAPSAANPNTTPVTKISYSTTGGRSGNYESLDITADSLIYLQAQRGHEKIFRAKTDKDFWSRLTKTVNLNDFDRIKSNPGHALYDGIDITLSIESGEEKHTVVNGNEDPVNYKRIQAFTQVLEQELTDFRSKITW